MDIMVKSTGFLLDEYITAQFKIEVRPTPENIHRGKLLQQAIKTRISGKEPRIEELYIALKVVSRACWNAQEVVMEGKNLLEAPYVNDSVWKRIARAGIEAQRMNAERNKIIREIDAILGEQVITTLEKTY